MPLTPIEKPEFPNVPDVAGVPQLRRSGLPALARIVLSDIEGRLWSSLTSNEKWGVYTVDLKPIAIADSVIDMGYRSSAKVSTFPVQAGGFASYNKVSTPFEATVKLSKGGGLDVLASVLDAGGFVNGLADIRSRPERLRSEFLDAIDAAQKSLSLYHVVTPEKTYTNCSIEEYSYRREQAAGARRIEVELSLTEIRQVQPQFSTIDPATLIRNPKQPEAAPPVSSGKVQTQPVPESFLRIIFGG